MIDDHLLFVVTINDDFLRMVPVTFCQGWLFRLRFKHTVFYKPIPQNRGLGVVVSIFLDGRHVHLLLRFLHVLQFDVLVLLRGHEHGLPGHHRWISLRGN